MSFVVPTRFESVGKKALGFHRFFMRSVSSAFNAFLWVFIFGYFTVYASVGQALTQTFLLYALMQTVTILLVPFAMRRLRGGMKRGLIYGTTLLIAALVYTGALLGGFFPHGLVAIGILLGAYRALYRVPYTLERAAVGRSEAPQFSVEVLLALLPIVVGLFFDFGATASCMFFTFSLLSAIALVPLVLVPNVHEQFSWGYRETFGHLSAPENNRLLTASVWQGIVGGALFLIWPIVLFLATRSYFAVGGIFGVTLLIILLSRAAEGRVFAEQHADGGTYLDEYTALKEMGLAIGRLLLGFGAVLLVALLQ